MPRSPRGRRAGTGWGVADRVPLSFPREAVLTVEDVARWWDMHPETVRDMDLPCFFPSPRHKRYLAGALLDWMEERTRALSAGEERPPQPVRRRLKVIGR